MIVASVEYCRPGSHADLHAAPRGHDPQSTFIVNGPIYLQNNLHPQAQLDSPQARADRPAQLWALVLLCHQSVRWGAGATPWLVRLSEASGPREWCERHCPARRTSQGARSMATRAPGTHKLCLRNNLQNIYKTCHFDPVGTPNGTGVRTPSRRRNELQFRDWFRARRSRWFTVLETTSVPITSPAPRSDTCALACGESNRGGTMCVVGCVCFPFDQRSSAASLACRQGGATVVRHSPAIGRYRRVCQMGY